MVVREAGSEGEVLGDGFIRNPGDPQDEADDEAGPLGTAGAMHEGGQRTLLR